MDWGSPFSTTILEVVDMKADFYFGGRTLCRRLCFMDEM